MSQPIASPVPPPESPGRLLLRIDHRIAIARGEMAEPAWQHLQAWATEKLTFINPVYWEARNHRRPCKHLAKQFVLYHQGEAELTLPRGVGGDLRKWLKSQWPELEVEVDDRRSHPALETPWTLQAELRDYQQAAVDRAVKMRDGVVVSPTGSGKTVMAMGLLARLATPALLLVHNRLLVDQIREASERFLGVEAGVIGAGQFEVRPLTVATVQTLMRRDLSELKNLFGVVVLDEAHHCPAPTFTEVVEQFAARWRLGLTATPERKDGLHPLMHAALGPELMRMQPRELLAVGSLSASRVTPVHTTFAGGRMDDHAEMMGKLASHAQRNHEILRVVLSTCGQRSLVLVERVEHCQVLAELLRDAGLRAWGLTGSVATVQRQEVLAQLKGPQGGILVATSSLVGEGFDCPALDTLYLAVPSANVTRVTQALGRVLRPHDGKIQARVYDFVDIDTPGLARTWGARLRVYRTHGARCDLAVAVADIARVELPLTAMRAAL